MSNPTIRIAGSRHGRLGMIASGAEENERARGPLRRVAERTASLREAGPVQPPRRPEHAGPARLSALRFEAVALWAGLIPLVLLTRPYAGIVRDGRIYLGRGLADRNPGGIGRDLMFAFDEQTGFSFLRPVIRGLLGIMSAPEASMALVLAGLAIWLGAAIAFATSLAAGRAAWAAIACILVLPPSYGGFGAFVYGEAAATPRIFAEAAVLGALAALMRRRHAASVLLLGLAVLLHPLMAMAGLAVAVVALVREAPRRFVPALLAAAALAAAAAAGWVVAKGLATPLDADWLSVLRPSRYLFPSFWPDETWGHMIRQGVAVIIAGTFLDARRRAVLWGIAAVASLGVAVSVVLADWLPTVLLTQLQPWRATWLLAVAGHASLALAAVNLWIRGPGGRLTLALLFLTWLASDGPLNALLLGAATLGLFAVQSRGGLGTIPVRLAAWIGAAAAVLALVKTVVATSLLLDLAGAGTFAGIKAPWSLGITLEAHTSGLVAAILAVAILAPAVWPRSARMGAAALLTASLAAGALLWDARQPDQRALGPSPEVAALREFLAPAPGEVLWLGGDIEAWFWAGRPGFASVLQRGPALFSRPLAITWKSRMDRLAASGLIRPGDIETWDSAQHVSAEPVLTGPAVEAFCRDPDRPAALVASGDQRAAVPADLPVLLWRSPAPLQRLTMREGTFHWQRVETYTIVRCRGVAGPA